MAKSFYIVIILTDTAIWFLITERDNFLISLMETWVQGISAAPQSSIMMLLNHILPPLKNRSLCHLDV